MRGGVWFLAACAPLFACAVSIGDVREKESAAALDAGNDVAAGGANSFDSGSPDAGCTPCSLPHATTSCGPNGACSIVSCEPSFVDCNVQPADGCEASIDADPKNCGSCDHDCASAGGSFTCSSGQCVPSSCTTGTGDCASPGSNACETNVLTDPQHCGFCANACSFANASAVCEAGSCKISVCDSGTFDCDGIGGNGCEANLQVDIGNCGSCGQSCSTVGGTPQCSNGICSTSCFPSRGNCDGNPANGCEALLGSDEDHCGACDIVCGTAHATSSTCSQGKCTLSCTSEWQNCDLDPENGCETFLSTSHDHCGSCANVCGPTQVCKNGGCTSGT